MKMGYIALALIILITSLLLMFNNYLENSADFITKLIEDMNYNIQNENYKKGYEIFLKLNEKWENDNQIIQLLIECDELDEIDLTIRELEVFFKKNVFEEFFEKSADLDFLINHIYERNKLSLETIF